VFLSSLVFVFNPCFFRYNQAVSMTRFYKRPILLIEFDPNKSFSLQVSVPKGSVILGHFSCSLSWILPKEEMDSTLFNACCNKNVARHVQEVLHYSTSCANWSQRRHTKFREKLQDIFRHGFFCMKMCSFPSTEPAK